MEEVWWQILYLISIHKWIRISVDKVLQETFIKKNLQAKEMWKRKINRLDRFFCFFWLFCPAPLWTAGGNNSYSRHKKTKGTAHMGHFFTAAISKFIETDWFLQIIVKLILPLNMKLERGMDAQWASPNIKTGGSWLTVKMFLWSVLSTKKYLHKST